MRKANMFVIKKDYIGDTAINNVVGYAIDSIFAEHDEILSAYLNMDSYESIVNDFYRAQKHIDMTKRRRLFHFVLSTPAAKDMERTLSEGAEVLLEYFETLGHQVLLVPHSSSNENHYNYHWHVVVNSVSSITGEALNNNYSTYNAIIHYLNENTCTLWSWMYK